MLVIFSNLHFSWNLFHEVQKNCNFDIPKGSEIYQNLNSEPLKTAQKADFQLLKSSKLISRKIWVPEKSWNFHIAKNSVKSTFSLIHQTDFLPYSGNVLNLVVVSLMGCSVGAGLIGFYQLHLLSFISYEFFIIPLVLLGKFHKKRPTVS